MSRCVAGIALALSLTTGGASAALSFALSPDGLWSEFVFTDAGNPWLDPNSSEEIQFTLSSTRSFSLRVVDVGFAGDRVTVYANGSLLGPTSTVAADDALFVFSADESFGDARWSQGIWTLPAGTYTFTGFGDAAPLGASAFAISALVDPATNLPLPATTAMALAGLLALAASRRRR